MDFSNINKVTKQYNWRGEHIGYQSGNASVPCDKRNTDYCQICDKIERGELIECEPNITDARKVYGENGKLTGFDTNLGFIPNREKNKLFQLLQKFISSEQCVLKEQAQTPPQDRVQTLILCVALDRRWQHLKGPFERLFSYRSHEKSQPIDVKVRIRNLPDPSTDVVMHVLNAFNVSPGIFEHVHYKSLQFGLIEIELPTKYLSKLFRNEKNYISEPFCPYVKDMFDLYCERTGRNPDREPGTDWLLGMAIFFLTRFFVDITNMAIRVFALEYGGVPPGHVREKDIFYSQLWFTRLENGQTRLYVPPQNAQSFGLMGQWPDGAAIQWLTNSQITGKNNLWIVKSRIDQMIEAGFALEALTVANAFLEVLLQESLAGVVSKDKKAESIIRGIGHRYRINLLKKIVDAKTEPGIGSDEFHDFTQSVEEIYNIRNNYLHQLKLPVDHPWRIVEMDRLVDRHLRFITDPSLAFRTIGFLSNLKQIVHPATLSLIIGEIQNNSECHREYPD